MGDIFEAKPAVELRKKQWGTTPRRREFDAVSTTAVGGNPPVPLVIRALG